MSTLGVSTGDLGKLANELRTSGDIVAKQVKKIGDNLFGPGEAGANYATEGKKIQSGLEQLKQRIDDWSKATDTTADVIGAASVSYTTVDDRRASETNKQ
ncbi:hypothetical protein IU433_18765 [Nocardia puris]|uniref:Excreted virulence factor EspC (Type VII ESX diderm) n=1 Tax=Nocardia puris TaxID=208602 RepID=A0A366DH52_9NOCA|nr:hypothetical protein [Nocardia puris]MBF6212489.1 hypothetical protein [Nocardia puris]MBF6366736.1 hypothetical protein [Nocardia puris]MBF6461078.1 hypothetical protein [Nocardia puris]RBO88849.1 hypothetical protein DFR74_10874 [Nocardia puris]